MFALANVTNIQRNKKWHNLLHITVAMTSHRSKPITPMRRYRPRSWRASLMRSKRPLTLFWSILLFCSAMILLWQTRSSRRRLSRKTHWFWPKSVSLAFAEIGRQARFTQSTILSITTALHTSLWRRTRLLLLSAVIVAVGCYWLTPQSTPPRLPLISLWEQAVRLRLQLHTPITAIRTF